MRRRLASLAALLLLTLAVLPARPVEASGISMIIPNQGSSAGGYNATIIGSGFAPNSAVYFGGVASPSVIYLDGGTISAAVPPGSGTVSVTVVGPDGSVSSPSQSFFYTGDGSVSTVLGVTAVSPSVGAMGGGTSVTITGSGFITGATVLFGGVPALATNVLSANLITATAPAGPLGAASIVITNPNGGSVVYNGFSFGTTTNASMTVSSVSPTSVPIGGGTTVALYGTGFLSGATVTFGGVLATNPIVYSTTYMSAVAPGGLTGSVPIVVTNPGGVAAVFTGFSYGAATTTTGTQPSILAVSPNSGSAAGGTTVTLTGSGFVSPATVSFGGVPATNVAVLNASTITATTPANTVGPVTVLVGGSGGQVGGLTAGFTYIVAIPLVSSITPATGLPQGGTPITITGSGFVPGATVTVGGVAATGVSVVGPTQINATTPPGSIGAAIVLVINPGGAISGLASAFSYSTSAPVVSPVTIASVSPASGALTGGTTVTITGSGFASGATVLFGNTIATSTFVSATQIVATTPPTATAGAVAVSVTNANGGGSATQQGAFTYASSTSTPPTGGTGSGPLVPAGGSGLFTFHGGTNAELLAASGCNASTAVFWTTDAHGTWIGYLPSVPVAIVNAAWNALFPNGIPANTPIFARCG